MSDGERVTLEWRPTGVRDQTLGFREGGRWCAQTLPANGGRVRWGVREASDAKRGAQTSGLCDTLPEAQRAAEAALCWTGQDTFRVWQQWARANLDPKAWYGPCEHGRVPWDRCDECGELDEEEVRRRAAAPKRYEPDPEGR